MPLTTTEQALQVSGAAAVPVILVKPRDPAAGDATVSIGIATESFWTEPGDSLPSFPFRGVLSDRSSVRLSEYLTSAGQITGESSVGVSSIRADVASGAQAAWRDLDWNGAEITLYVGATYRADGQRMAFSEFDTVLSGLVERADPVGDGQWEITFADPRAGLKVPAVQKFYRGFGGGIYLTGDTVGASDRVRLVATGSPLLTLGPPWTIEVIGRLATAPSGTTELFAMVQSPIAPSGFLASLTVDSLGQVNVNFDFGGGSSTYSSSSLALAAGDTFYLALVALDSSNLKLYLGNDTDTVLLEDSFSVSPATIPTAGFTEIRQGLLSGAAWQAWESRLWSVAKTQEELESLGDGPVTDATDRSDLVESWRYAEGAEIGTGPEICFGEKSVIDFTNGGSGTPVWVSSYEGDDPDLFPGSPAGQSKAKTWGPAENVLLTLIDSQRPAFTWDHAIDGITDPYRVIRRLRQTGVPMVRNHTITSASLGDYSFDAATNSVTITGGSSTHETRFTYFVPGQADPARLGQRIVVTGTASNNATWRVAVAGVSEDGLTMVLADGPAVVNESAPAGTTIASHPADIQWTGYESANPYPRVELPSIPSGDLTIDLINSVPGGFGFGLWTAMHEEISGETSLDTSAVTFNPTLSLHLPPGSDRTKKDLLDQLARSAFGWWIENPAGGHILGTWQPPAGTPVEALTEDRIVSIRPLRTTGLPVGQFALTHTPVWHQQSGDSLAGSVSVADRRRWSEPSTTKKVVDRRIRDTRFPLHDEIPELETLLSLPDEITSFVALASPFHFKEPRWYTLTMSLWGFFIRRNDVVEVTWDDPDLELSATPCRVTGRRVDLGRGTIELDIFWLKDEPT